MNAFRLTDAAIERALTPGLDVSAPPDFTEQIARMIEPTTHRSRLGLLSATGWRRQAMLAAQLFLLLVLLLLLLVGYVVVASRLPAPLPNGDVIVASGSQLLDVDPVTGTSAPLVTGGSDLFGVTRSDDGSLISFWTSNIDGTALEVMSRTGSDRRQVATNLIPPPLGQGQVDMWSPDRRSLAAGVLAAGQPRLLIVDIESGNGEYVGPVGAANPLWSPDGRLLAFSYMRGGRSVLALMRPDGSGLDEISGDLGGFDVSGANNWTPDGAWVYFGAQTVNFVESRIYRARVDGHYSEQLTSDVLSAAPALSPDGSIVAYSDWPNGKGTQNLMIMDADGGNQRLLLASAVNDGWSNDGQFLLAEWRPPGAAYELVSLRPDGTDQRTLMTFEGGCVDMCVKSLGWGQPRP